MKPLAKKILSLCLTGALLTGLMAPAFAAAEGTDTKVYNDKGRELHFLDIGSSGLETDEVKLYTKAIQSNGFFKDWVSLAYNIFESQPKSYWDHAGNGWDGSYGKDGEYIDFVDYMLNAKSRTVEEAGLANENVGGYVSTGLSVAGSLQEVQKRAADDIASLPNRKLTGADFLARHEIDALTDAPQTVLYSTVTTFDRYGRTEQIGYDSFTIAFYDFQLHVLSNEDELSGTVTTNTTDVTDGLITLFENDGLSDATQSATLSNSVTETLSSSITNSESYTFGQSIGATYTYAQKVALPAPVVGDSTHSIAITGNLSFSQAMSTAYSESESHSETTNKSSTVTSTVPAHTKTTAQQTTATARVTTTFDCPVGISYKVAIFSMCGTCYDDNAAVQRFDTAGYEQRSFVTIFGGSTDAADAVESLYQRATNHRDSPSYDESYGRTAGTNDDGNAWCTGLNWNTIIGQGAPSSSVSGLKGGTDLTYALDDTYPMSSSGGSTSVIQESISTVQGEALPLLPIASTYITWQLDNEWSLDRAFELTVGETVPITSYRVKACDKDSVPYYGFVATKGTWKIVDQSGKEITSPVAKTENDPVTGAQILTATGPGTVYVKYFIPENTYYTWDGVVSTNANISSPAYKVVVSAPPEEAPEPFTGTITLEGSVAAVVGEPVNLNTELAVTAYDPTGREADVTLSWQAQELESKGISVTPDGALTATAPGTFHVRAYCDDVYSNWVEVVAQEPAELIQYICYHPFADVPHQKWYDPAVEFVYQNNLMNGTAQDVFTPAGQVTRAQAVQTLYRLAGEPAVTGEHAFTDVPAESWYAKAVAWAAETGITTGRSDALFAPLANVTREELAAFIVRCLDATGLVPTIQGSYVDMGVFPDEGTISPWAREAMKEALKAGILSGHANGALAPQGTATRAEMAQMMMNLLREQEA